MHQYIQQIYTYIHIHTCDMHTYHMHTCSYLVIVISFMRFTFNISCNISKYIKSWMFLQQDTTDLLTSMHNRQTYMHAYIHTSIHICIHTSIYSCIHIRPCVIKPKSSWPQCGIKAVCGSVCLCMWWSCYGVLKCSRGLAIPSLSCFV